MRWGRPASTPASMAAPMSLVWMWQFHRPSPADHDDGVADAGPHLLERLDGVVGRGQEVHHLVAQVADRVLRRRPSRRPRLAGRSSRSAPRGRGPATPEGSGRGRPSSTRRNASSRSRNPPPPASTTPAWASTGQHLGRPGQRVGRLAPGALDDAHQARTRRPPRPPAGAPATVRMVPSTGRTTARRASSEAWPMASTRTLGPDAGVPGRRHPLAHAPQELRQDHARVPPGPHQRPVPDGLADGGQAGPGLDALELADHGLEGQRHVGARCPRRAPGRRSAG